MSGLYNDIFETWLFLLKNEWILKFYENYYLMVKFCILYFIIKKLVIILKFPVPY